MTKNSTRHQRLGTLIATILICGCSTGGNATAEEFRTWTTSSGQKSSVALAVVNHDATSVQLKRQDNGKVITLQLEQLSDEDQAYLRNLKPTATTASSQASSQWHCFRGPDGNGATDPSRKLPLTWSDDESVLWKLPLPGAGASSPVVWGDHIYLTCFTGTQVDPDESRAGQPLKLMVTCVDLNSGRMLWNREISDVEQVPDEHNQRGNEALRLHGLASNTPFATADGVYVFFGATGLFRFAHDGKETWRKSCGTGWHQWASATSPIVFSDRVIINAAFECKSILAFNTKTGDEAWRVQHIGHTWVPPTIVKIKGRDVLLDTQHAQLVAMNPSNGKRLWVAYGFDGGTVTLIQNETAYQLKRAFRLGHSSAEELWAESSGGRVPGPVLHNNRLYFCTEGKFQCRDAKTGDFVYRERSPHGASSYASALLNGDRVYFVTRKHGTFVVRASDEFELLAHNKLDSDNSAFNASPAVAGNRLILRSNNAIYCFGNDE